MDGVLCELRRRLQIQLFFHVRFMSFDCLYAEVQPFRDLTRGKAISHHLENFKLAVAQVIDRGGRSFLPATDETHHGLFGDLWA